MQRINSSLKRASVNYRLLRIASEKYGKLPANLETQQYRNVSAIAAREFLIEQAVLSSPEALDVFVPQSQIAMAVNQIASRYSEEAEFLLEMANNGLTLPELRQALERELRLEAVLGLVGSRVSKVDNTDAKLFYYMNRDRIERPELRAARHILITVNPDFPENTAVEARKRIEQIRQRLDKKPKRFAEQATKHSECTTSLNGGLLGRVKREDLYPELSTVLFAMQEGEISDVVESQVGLHLLHCEQITPAGTAALAEVEEKIRGQLQQRQQSRYTRQWIQELVKAQNHQPDETMADAKEFA